MGILLPQYNDDDLKTVIINYDEIYKDVQNYSGKFSKEANIFLNNHLSDIEKNILYDSYYSADDGWFTNSSHGIGASRLKITALSLGLTHNLLSFNQEQKNTIRIVNEKLTDDDLRYLQSAYLKQKIITYKTLMNKSDEPGFNNSVVKLYRGVKTIDNIEYSISLESWTADREIAIKFSDGGYVFRRKVSFEKIYLFYQSTFQWDENPLKLKEKSIIDSETEYILENMSSDLRKIEGIDYLLSEEIIQGREFNDH